MLTDLRFEKLRTINHDSKVIVFGESNGTSNNPKDRAGKLWYKVLDLEQIADQDNPNAWDDNTRWTDWMEIPYPKELRDVALSLLTIRQTVDDRVHDQLKTWRVLSNGNHLYLEPIRKISWEPEAMLEMLPIIDIKTQFSRGRNGYIGQN
jgi:hypothetical protein